MCDLPNYLLIFQEKLAQWQEEKSQLESQIELITKAHTEDLENERVGLNFSITFYTLHFLLYNTIRYILNKCTVPQNRNKQMGHFNYRFLLKFFVFIVCEDEYFNMSHPNYRAGYAKSGPKNKATPLSRQNAE